MGCAESREKEKISSISSSFSFIKSPLPLHIYPKSDSTKYISTPKSSPTALITTSVTTSLITSPASSPKNASPKNASSTNTSPKNATTVATTYITRLTSIAHHKFSTFSEFPKNVQTEILHHIDKELRKQ